MITYFLASCMLCSTCAYQTMEALASHLEERLRILQALSAGLRKYIISFSDPQNILIFSYFYFLPA